MFADPITITVNAVAKAMVRINSGDPYASEYYLKEGNTQEWRLKIRNSSYTDKAGNTIDRHNVEFVNTVYATATVKQIVRKIYTVIENYRSDSLTDPLNVSLGAIAFLTSANVTKMLNYES